MTRIASPLIVASLVHTLSACSADFDDVSADPRYSSAVGKVCNLQSSINAYGVALKLGPHKKTNVVALTSFTSSGPEITFRMRLAQGTRLQVLAVRRCTNCPFDERVEYQVLVDPMLPELASYPVYLNLERVAPEAISCPTLSVAA